MDDALTVSINYIPGISRIFCLYFFAKSRYINGFSQQKSKQYYSRYYQKVIKVIHRFHCFEILFDIMSTHMMVIYVLMLFHSFKNYVEIFVAVKSLHHDKKSILHNCALHLIRQVIISTMQARLL